ncbi:hypothetical protein CERSUDRAFT_26796, partial [Gelatoporia subvermispora B]
LLRKVADVTSDKWSNGPFYLAHADFSPPNILVEVEGPNAGEITAVIDWEMAFTAPAWNLLTYPDWFANCVPWLPRDQEIAAMFRKAYVEELRALGFSKDFLDVVQRDCWRRGFAEIAMLPW